MGILFIDFSNQKESSQVKLSLFPGFSKYEKDPRWVQLVHFYLRVTEEILNLNSDEYIKLLYLEERVRIGGSEKTFADAKADFECRKTIREGARKKALQMIADYKA